MTSEQHAEVLEILRFLVHNIAGQGGAAGRLLSQGRVRMHGMIDAQALELTQAAGVGAAAPAALTAQGTEATAPESRWQLSCSPVIRYIRPMDSMPPAFGFPPDLGKPGNARCTATITLETLLRPGIEPPDLQDAVRRILAALP